MDRDAFLSAASSGDLPALRSIRQASDSRASLQVCDSGGNNALHLSLLGGHWKAAVYLMREGKVSSHKVNNEKETVLHSYVRGVARWTAPTSEDFSDMRAELILKWEEEFQFETQRQASVLALVPKARPIPKASVSAYSESVFSQLSLVLPRFFIETAHVYPYTQNIYGQTCKDLACALSLSDLSDYFEKCLQPAAAKRRLLSGLTDDLLREVAEML